MPAIVRREAYAPTTHTTARAVSDRLLGAVRTGEGGPFLPERGLDLAVMLPKHGMEITARIRTLNAKKPTTGRYVLYWMQQAQRAEWNHALEFAVGRANALRIPLVVAFGLTARYPQANVRHYRFMLEGLHELERALARRKILLVVRRGEPPEVALELSEEAAEVVCDRGYLRHQRLWRQALALHAGCPVVQVEADAIVPVDEASDKREFSARTLRPKLHRQWLAHLEPLRTTPVDFPSVDLDLNRVDLADLDTLLAHLELDHTVAPVSNFFLGGTRHARRLLRAFIQESLSRYEEARTHPALACVSYMSPYLHFGQISPIYIASEIRRSDPHEASSASYLEELLVRRELALNFVRFTKDYDRYEALPDWARRTLDAHRNDERSPSYDRATLEAAQTEDPYWNAAMREMKYTGYMHNHMRMYWGKKILEWSECPEEAYRIALELNNKYFVDGRDPASFANVGWLFGLHDRPWPERSIFGTVRSMSASGLRRKTNPQAYVDFVRARIESASNAT